MAGHAVEAKQSGAELRPGQSHQLHAEALARADFVLAGTGRPTGQLSGREGVEESHFASENSLFYKTLNGAEVGDLYMSLIHTCELNGVNPFDYLTELQPHTEELGAKPAEWMPWSYRDTLARPAC